MSHPDTLIAEDLLLLLMDDEKGRLSASSQAQPLLGGALLVQLALDGAVEVEETNSRWRPAKVEARQVAGTDPDPLLAGAWETVAQKPRSAQDLVSRLGKGVREQLQDRLVAKGMLERRQTRVLGLFPSTVWPAADRQHEQQVRQRLQDCLVAGAAPDARTAALVALLAAVDQAHKVVDRGALSTGEVKRRAKAISEGAWAAKAVRDAVAASQAAITAAVMASTAATVSAGS
ncbi:GOLPH3/VPS74 family protein [Nocardioides houyundeii]|uniref:GOLPH3/VPS74 family protein n=1 Tax=Nocardioides houyundeii TaxID=2045452 RepID=UPI000C777157|nr:GPP34 family phosphoprotein [Nocardioides houyundeii]